MHDSQTAPFAPHSDLDCIVHKGWVWEQSVVHNVKIFQGHSVSALEQAMNDWFGINPNVDVIHVAQTESDWRNKKTRITLTVLYQENIGHLPGRRRR